MNKKKDDLELSTLAVGLETLCTLNFPDASEQLRRVISCAYYSGAAVALGIYCKAGTKTDSERKAIVDSLVKDLEKALKNSVGTRISQDMTKLV